MKKFLHKMFAVLVLGLFSMAAMAETETINLAGSWEGTYATVEGTNASEWGYDPGLVVYQAYQGTVTAKEGYKLVKMELNLGEMGYGTPVVSVGTMTSMYVWECAEGATSVVLSAPGEIKIYGSITVTVVADAPSTPDPLQTAYEAWKELLTGKMQAVYDDCGGFYGQAPTEDEVGKKPAAVVAAVYNHVKEYSIVFDSYMGFGDNWSGANDYLVATYGKDIEALYAEALAIWEAYENAALVEAEEEEATLVKEGVATGAYTDFEGHDVELEEVPVAYAKYSDGSIVLKNFWNTGVDLKVKLDEPYEFEGTNCANVLIDDVEGFGATAAGTTFFAFVNPVTYNEETSKGLLLGGYSRYMVEDDELDLYYQNADGAYMCFFVDLASEFVGEDPTGVDTVLAATSNKIYDLAGRRVVKVQKGINIVNGKVVLK